MASTALKNLWVSEADYLMSEESAPYKSEYIDGYIYAMAAASANHNRIAGNFHTAFNIHLKGKPCQPYTSDMKVNIGTAYFYPDVIVDCSDTSDYYTKTPTIIVEVLSKSTRYNDETRKRQLYLQIPTLQEYILVEQDFVDIEVVRKSQHWRSSRYYLGDSFTLESIGLTLSVADIYERVKNSDMEEWLAKQQEIAVAKKVEG